MFDLLREHLELNEARRAAAPGEGRRDCARNPAAVPGMAGTDFMQNGGVPTRYNLFRGDQARALVGATALEDARVFGGAVGYPAAA